MTAVAVKGSSGFPGALFKQSQAAGAKTTWLFHLAKSADGTDDTGVVPVVSISKAGGAFAGAAGVVSEISGGWYKIAFTNVDLGTLGALAINVAVATADTINEVAQVVAFDPYDSAILGLSTLTTILNDVNALDTGSLPTRTTVHSLGTLTTGARTSGLLSLLTAVTATVSFGGTAFHGGSVQVKVSEDGVNYVNYGSASTDNSTPVTIAEPHFSIEAVLTGGDSGGTTSIPVTLTINTNTP